MTSLNWSESELENVICPLCGTQPGIKPIYDFLPFRLVACRQCGLKFLSPRLNQSSILKLYQRETYFQSETAGQGYDEYLEVAENWHKTFSKRLERIRKYRSTGQILDVGCGPGFFMEVAEKWGYKIWGVDVSEYIIHKIHQRLKLQVRQGTIDTVDFLPGSLDVITAFDVFEHIYDPVGFIQRAHYLLSYHGLLVITTPNAQSLLARLWKQNWVSIKIPEHIFYWSPSTITKIVKNGFKILEICRAGQYATLGFLIRRLIKTGYKFPEYLKPLLGVLNQVSIYADNGSFTMIAEKTNL